MKRRTFLQGTLASGAIAMAAGSGLLAPSSVLAAWNKGAFEAKGLSEAMKNSLGTDQVADSDKIKIKAPDIAENGAVVPVTVTSNIAGTESISIFAEQNATPLSSIFNLGKTTEGYVSTRIKMGKTSNVIAVVVAGGKQFKTQKEVKVTIGGCGG